jgi:hypothetical protein
MVLRRSIEQLEPGLTIIDGDREQTVASARIDITTGSQQTLRWREMDSNYRSPVRRTTLFETPLSQHARAPPPLAAPSSSCFFQL